jgi:hypothetical protein
MRLMSIPMPDIGAVGDTGADAEAIGEMVTEATQLEVTATDIAADTATSARADPMAAARAEDITVEVPVDTQAGEGSPAEGPTSAAGVVTAVDAVKIWRISSLNRLLVLCGSGACFLVSDSRTC